MKLTESDLGKLRVLFETEAFQRWYIYTAQAIIDMLRDATPEDVQMALVENVYGLSTRSGKRLSAQSDQDKYGHSGYSMAHTVYATQHIIKHGVDHFIARFSPDPPAVEAPPLDTAGSP